MSDGTELAVGGTLRRARQERGLSIAEVAQQLKFAPRQLEALEEERYDALPGATIARGMVRNYARLLKLDPEPLVAQLAQRMQAPDASRLAARYSEPVPFSDGGRRSNVVYLSLSVIILMVVAGIAYQWYEERRAPPRLAFVAPASAPAVSQPTSAPTLAEVPVSEPAAPAKAPAPEPAAPEPAAPEPAAPVATAGAPVRPATDALQESASKPAGSHRLVFRFERESWIEVRDGAGRLLLAQLAPEGAERVVQGRAPLTLVVGNAKHVQLTMDEKPVDFRRHTKSDVARFQLP